VNLTRRQAIQALASAAAPLALAQGAKPNLLFIFADDMGWSDVGFNGRKEWQTPNLDRLASQGTIFDRWYTACPLCAPSRAALMTGKYGIHNTVRANVTDLPSSEVTIAEALKPLGYTTALIGKWHHGNLPGGGFTHPIDQGFDSTFGYLDARHAWEHYPKAFFRGKQEVPVSGYSSDILADETIQFLKANRSNPFYLHLAFIEPHFLIEAPEEDVKLYEGKFKEKDPAQPYNARYAGMIHRLDASIGRVLKALDELGLANNTLVVFTSDNGATFEAGNKGASAFHDSNRPHRGQKRSLEEGGIRMPACVRWPGRVAAGKRSDALVHNVDILPTFVAAAGGGGPKPDPAWKVDGVNMLDVWTGKSPAPDRTVFWEFKTEGVNMAAAMRGDFKLLDIGGNQYLYNVKQDPQERRTIFAEHPEVFQKLKSELSAWLATATPA
jgi:arylsulfatase A-like enzyme